jgi:4-amino-4-deoxy-L-arabinose transferase-like glycosyltransferase
MVFNRRLKISNQRLPSSALRTRTDGLLLAGFCAFLFFYGLGAFGLIGADEPRYAQVAREMLDRHDWITPLLGGHPWLEKPPLYYWQAMVAYSVLGVSDTAARVPSALDATLLVVAVYLFFRRFRRGVEVDAALITASSAGVIGYARAASMDMPLAATFGIAMLAWWAWRESGERVYLALFYAFLALGMLAKGPVAPFLAALIIALFAAITREQPLISKTLWLPGILLFGGLALPWYILVQLHNPQFVREFILEHNLERFSTNLYHHPEPFWYYLPVALLALVPWLVFAIAAFVRPVRIWWAERKSTRTIAPEPGLTSDGLERRRHPEPSRSSDGAEDLAHSAENAGSRGINRPAASLPPVEAGGLPECAGLRDDAGPEARTEPLSDLGLQFNLFACCWLIVPVVFFSFSRSKLPGYILPSVPAAAVLLGSYLREQFNQQESLSKWMSALHAIIAAAPIAPAILIGYIVTERSLPKDQPTLYFVSTEYELFAFAIAFVLALAVALTLMSRLGLRMLRFVTLVPVVLAVAAVLKLGTVSIDRTLSARPLARALASLEMHQLPLAVCGASRELEYGLAFYRNQIITRCELSPLPAQEHLLIAPSTWKSEVARQTAGRPVSFLGHYSPQNVDYYWVAGDGVKP